MIEDSDDISECPTPTPQKPMGVKVLPPVVPTAKKTDIPAKYLPAAAVLTIAPSPKPPPGNFFCINTHATFLDVTPGNF